jgi:hypothetical protein
MSNEKKQIPTWKVNSKTTNYQWEGVLVAYWEVSLDLISDDYTPQEIDAQTLFKKWVKLVDLEYPNGLIPIHWFVEHQGRTQTEFMPFEFKHYPNLMNENFLTFYNWPVNSLTGKRLNWLELPVIDKFWNSMYVDKGGFIQEATGWKPSILQPYVYLPTLTQILEWV